MNILIDSVSFTYPSGVTALEDVSLEIASGECLAIVGQNGAGKTTLVKHFNGLLKPTSGQVRVGGWDTLEWPISQMAARVGYVFQNPDDQLFQSTVWDEVIFGPRNLGWENQRIAELAKAALHMVTMSEFRDRHPYDLSPSQRKLVAMAAVLAMDTPVLILDEPTTGQDWSGTELLGRIVEQLKAQGRTIVSVTHDVDFCAEHFERVVVMALGRVVLDGPAREVLAQGEILSQTYVDSPQLIRLADRLNLTGAPLTAEEFYALWEAQ